MNPIPILLIFAAFAMSAFAIGGIGRRDPAVNSLGIFCGLLSFACAAAAAFFLVRFGP